MQPRILLDGMEWQKSDQALRKLKQMLWGFVALREFGDKLKNAIEAVTRARDSVKKSLEKVSATSLVDHSDTPRFYQRCS